jgi:crotonobetainyl-CoA:carnitine CoA-transferase CaiB-like acyl-CoA transferase
VTRPFEGVKILDFTQVLAGPYASYQLALLGADVIKVERREGEDMRRTPLSREWADRGLAPGWQAVNGNKRSLTLDLQKPEAITIVKQLAAQADVVMENFRPGVMDKLGIGYAALSSLNPRAMTARSRRCRVSCRSPATRKPGRPVPALRSATCCPALRLRSVCRARCSSEPIPARAS